MRHATLRQLRAFDAVLRTGTVTAAAHALGVTPPAVTAQVKALEAETGLALLERQGERYVPTDAGARLRETVRGVEALLADCARRLAAARDGSAGSVALGVVSTAKYFVPGPIAAFRRRHPDVEIRLHVGNRGEAVEGLSRGDLDVAVMGRPPEGLDVLADEIGDHPLVLVAPPDHRLAGLARLPPAALVGETVLLREPGSGTRSAFEATLGGLLPGPRGSVEMRSNETIKQAAMAGLGVAFLSAHTCAAELGAGRLVVLDVDGLPAWRTWYVVSRRDRRLSPAADALHAFWAEQGAAFLPRVAAAPGLSRR